MSDDGVDYDPGEIDELIDAMQQALNDYDQRKGTHRATPRSLEVKAQVEWAGELQGPGGVRHVNLGARGGMPLDLSRVRDALKQTGGPLKSYKAKGWQAQLRQLNAVKRGTAAKQAAGLSPSRETLRRWERGEQRPSKANRERIQEAYGQLRNPSGMTPEQARARAADALTDALYNAYGSPVRFRDIQTFKFDD
jgi:hypothetical protein